ncbi:MAG: DUF721 domain-containing protein [Tannerellaceae bacterium]|jgi:hypothetical protein|nr:DUF721 domain-containing protein [Tannerellaceae bacterium]
MRRKDAQTIGEMLKLFFEDNAGLYEKILEIRVQRGWGEILGPTVLRYTSNIYVRNHILYVSLTSSVLRSELTFSRDKLVRSLNKYAGANIIHDIIIR